MGPGFRGTLVGMIRTAALGLTLVSVAAATSPALAEERAGGAIGLGLSIGDPTGITGEYHRRAPGFGHALELTIGIENFGDGDDFYAHLIWKFYITELLRHADFDVPIYTGVGPWISGDNDRDNDTNLDIGGRVPFGIAMDFRKAPIQVFFEVAVEAQLIDDFGIDIEGAIGFRYYF